MLPLLLLLGWSLNGDDVLGGACEPQMYFARDATTLVPNKNHFTADLMDRSERADGCAASGFLLKTPLLQGRRNHDCVIDEESFEMVNILGRWARTVESRNLLTGASRSVRSHGTDPAGWRVDDLNHVYAVRVRSLVDDRDELWLPCGFHGDNVNAERSASFARIVHLDSLNVTVGPRLLRSGGACSALALHLDGPERPAHVCTFGGTDGTHDKGTLLTQVACFDRRAQRWHQPFPPLPVGLDHSNAALVPAGTCGADEPARIVLLNFRTGHYSGHVADVLELDVGMPANGTQQLSSASAWRRLKPSMNVSGASSGRQAHSTLTPRDASGLVSAAGGRYLLNFGGVHYRTGRFGETQVHVQDEVRALDVCHRSWAHVRRLGVPLFALQTCSSAALGLSVSCGGQSAWRNMLRVPVPGTKLADMNFNFDSCIAHRFPSQPYARLETRCPHVESGQSGASSRMAGMGA